MSSTISNRVSIVSEMSAYGMEHLFQSNRHGREIVDIVAKVRSKVNLDSKQKYRRRNNAIIWRGGAQQ